MYAYVKVSIEIYYAIYITLNRIKISINLARLKIRKKNLRLFWCAWLLFENRVAETFVCWEVCPTWWIANGNDYCDEFASFEHLPGTLEQVSFMQVYLLLNVRSTSLNIACRIVFIKFDLNCCVMRAVPEFFSLLFKTCSNLVPSNLDYVTSLINTTNHISLLYFHSKINEFLISLILPIFSPYSFLFFFLPFLTSFFESENNFLFLRDSYKAS